MAALLTRRGASIGTNFASKFPHICWKRGLGFWGWAPPFPPMVPLHWSAIRPCPLVTLLRDLIKQHHRGKGGPNPKTPNHISDKYGGILGQNGHQWTRLAELERLPRVSAPDLVSQIKLCRKSFQTQTFSPSSGWRKFCYSHK